jgi:hypothetical protein
VNVVIIIIIIIILSRDLLLPHVPSSQRTSQFPFPFARILVSSTAPKQYVVLATFQT